MKKIRIFALLCACAMFLSAYLLIKQREEAALKKDVPQVKTVTKAAAAFDLGPYTVLNTENTVLVSVEVPADSEDDTCFYTIEDAVGRIVCTDIFEGEVITQKRALSPDDERLGLSMQISPGMRAITVNVDSEQAVGYNLKVGNRVDLIYTTDVDIEEENLSGESVPLTAGQGLTLKYGEENPANTVVVDEEMKNTVSVTAVQDVRVAALSGCLTKNEMLSEYDTVTFEVTPSQAAKIALMEKTGTLRIVLRSPGDDVLINDKREGVLAMFSNEGVPADKTENHPAILMPDEEPAAAPADINAEEEEP